MFGQKRGFDIYRYRSVQKVEQLVDTLGTLMSYYILRIPIIRFFNGNLSSCLLLYEYDTLHNFIFHNFSVYVYIFTSS